ncbi:hypothetical protein BD289DRAFT_242143 [Coniella lustricola]|uniref:Secreted protein n=1 Tax=Coniella lustricola TaxID=2025994 RepID=A0A2T3A9L2_9PEZI|nr:hypothetical protein BD289DRAFT_242143 [Coniella lustricola]
MAVSRFLGAAMHKWILFSCALSKAGQSHAAHEFRCNDANSARWKIKIDSPPGANKPASEIAETPRRCQVDSFPPRASTAALLLFQGQIVVVATKSHFFRRLIVWCRRNGALLFAIPCRASLTHERPTRGKLGFLQFPTAVSAALVNEQSGSCFPVVTVR